MSFLAPHWLWLLLLVPALAATYVFLQVKRRSKFAVRFTNLALLDTVAPNRPGWRRHVPAAIFLAGSAALILSIAKPARAEDVPRERATIVMAIDTSLSMLADDISPSRMDAAKEAAIESLDLIEPNINVGLVSFHGEATIQVPPTTDRELLKVAIDRLELGEGTATGEAIFSSLDMIAQQLEQADDIDDEEDPAHIVLMSDGHRTMGREDLLATAAALDAGVPVSTIAFGTEFGVITIPQEVRPIAVPVDHPAMQSIADATEGSFHAAYTADELRDVYTEIGTAIGFEEELVEISDRFTAGALILFLAAAAASLFWFARLP